MEASKLCLSRLVTFADRLIIRPVASMRLTSLFPACIDPTIHTHSLLQRRPYILVAKAIHVCSYRALFPSIIPLHSDLPDTYALLSFLEKTRHFYGPSEQRAAGSLQNLNIGFGGTCNDGSL